MTQNTTTSPADKVRLALWQQLTAAMNALEDAGLPLIVGDRKGPETDWETAPYVYTPYACDAPSAQWDRVTKRWTVAGR
ncbi:hypothetical protein ACIQCR_16850 [Streptomyces sp. NPDC093249]|uniref:hypothetical protein n=1 Tax=unclassified Streptomyces TaxID=2593676 RepID=UPI00344EB917